MSKLVLNFIVIVQLIRTMKIFLMFVKLLFDPCKHTSHFKILKIEQSRDIKSNPMKLDILDTCKLKHHIV